MANKLTYEERLFETIRYLYRACAVAPCTCCDPQLFKNIRCDDCPINRAIQAVRNDQQKGDKHESND